MNENTMLEMLKIDLGISNQAYNERLSRLLKVAAEEIEREGITLSASIGDGDLQVMYAAWLWRHRQNGDAMPRMLRYRLNNRLFAEKMGSITPNNSNEEES